MYPCLVALLVRGRRLALATRPVVCRRLGRLLTLPLV